MLQEHMPPQPPSVPPAEPSPLPPPEAMPKAPEHGGSEFETTLIEIQEIQAEGTKFGVAKIAKKDVDPGHEQSKKAPDISEDASKVFPKERMAVVCDGQGGVDKDGGDNGAWASRYATDNILDHVTQAKEQVVGQSHKEKTELWNAMIADNQFIDEDEAARFKETQGVRRANAIAALTAEARAVHAPESVIEQALATYVGLGTLSESLHKDAPPSEKGREPKTTLCGFKLMEADGRRFVIMFGVGDGENFISYPDPEHPGEMIVIQGVPSDGLADVMISRGDRTAEELNDMSDNLSYNARYEANVQFLGQSTEKSRVRSHVKIHELPSGVDVDLLLASDGLSGGDAAEDFKTTLASDATPEDKAQTMIRRSIKGFRGKEGKTRPDDIEVIVARAEAQAIEIQDNEIAELEATDTDWSLLVEAMLAKEGITGTDRNRIQDELLSEPVQKALAYTATQEAEQKGINDPRGVTELLKEHIGRRIIDLRLEPLEERLQARGELHALRREVAADAQSEDVELTDLEASDQAAE